MTDSTNTDAALNDAPALVGVLKLHGFHDEASRVLRIMHELRAQRERNSILYMQLAEEKRSRHAAADALSALRSKVSPDTVDALSALLFKTMTLKETMLAAASAAQRSADVLRLEKMKLTGENAKLTEQLALSASRGKWWIDHAANVLYFSLAIDCQILCNSNYEALGESMLRRMYSDFRARMSEASGIRKP